MSLLYNVRRSKTFTSLKSDMMWSAVMPTSPSIRIASSLGMTALPWMAMAATWACFSLASRMEAKAAQGLLADAPVSRLSRIPRMSLLATLFSRASVDPEPTTQLLSTYFFLMKTSLVSSGSFGCGLRILSTDMARARERSGLSTASSSSAFHSHSSPFFPFSSIWRRFSSTEFTKSFPPILKMSKMPPSHALSSSVMLRTLLMWTPSLRCVPEHSMQRVTVRFSDAQSGIGAPQSAQRSLPGIERISSSVAKFLSDSSRSSSPKWKDLALRYLSLRASLPAPPAPMGELDEPASV
mmetsp:Transcript_12782/g.32288  ORF Transcript_12782/g.32288 Transcript_12782/m.32288 type:complete len:296 (+) Transcript_12782:257-1144(+)